ncbi:ATPase [hydrothermal vent metagenome]|uniref:ATPase n=1 Tax=hydrothermal vent metagenome TaxID=652676 RepID=A0A3B0UVF9_9ZZZZ
MISRKLSPHIQKMLGKFPVVSLTGPRQSGKTTLLKNAFPDYVYYNLERMDHRELIISDPIGFLKTTGNKVIFDEAQNLPELFSYIQVISDERNIPGQYILSGSQSFLLNHQIVQTLAGRVNVNHLFPFDITELESIKNLSVNQIILNGFYPRLYDKHISPDDFYPSYLETYIQRDVRTLKGIENLNAFSRFLGLCAGRIGQVLNLTSLANDAGIAVNTAKAWLSLLEASFIIYQIQPYYKNFSKRLIKSPKLYFYDTGVACSLLRLTNPEMINTHYLYGSLFENLVISEILKNQCHSGKRPSVYYWRESNGVEIDCIVERGNNEILALEIKGGQTFTKDYMKNLRNFAKNEAKVKINKAIVYAGEQAANINDVQLIPWSMLSSKIDGMI